MNQNHSLNNQMVHGTIKIYQYLFYMTCPNSNINPFFFVPELDKEDLILAEINADFSTEYGMSKYNF